MLPIALPLDPMLARAVADVPVREPGALSYEPKWDGFRCIAARDGDEVTLWSRSRKPTHRLLSRSGRRLPPLASRPRRRRR